MKTSQNWKNHLPLLLDILHQLALALWLGGLVTLWLALMPAAFHDAELTVRQSEMVMGATLRRFVGLAEIAGLTMIAAQFLLRRRYRSDRRAFVADGVRQLLTFSALLLAELAMRALLPQMDSARQQVHLTEFHHLHQVYAALATAQTLLLITVSILTGVLSAHRKTQVPGTKAGGG